MKTIRVSMFFDEQQNYVRCSAYSIQHNCSLAEAQQALFGDIVYDWGE